MNMEYFSKDGIFPLGDYDYVPTEQTKTEYPEVVDLGYQVDADLLYKEYVAMKKPSKDHYYLQMSKKFTEDKTKVMKNFEDLGFLTDNYGGYDMKRAGAYTKQVMDDLPVELFRKHYTMAEAGWESKLHSDHQTFDTHGFRLVIPVNVDAHIKYKHNHYRLQRGGMYFWNIVREHAGWNPLNEQRIIIMAQMNTDRLINHGTILDPINIL